MLPEQTLPEEKRAAIERGLNETFGTATIDDIQKMTRGLTSDAIFRIVVAGSPYLLRVVMRVNEQTDPSRHFASMRAAADGGVAPRVWYANVEDGVAITDFVVEVPLSTEEARARIPLTLRTLHALAPFPKTFSYVTANRFFISRFRTANLVPSTEAEEVYARYAQLVAVYPQVAADMVPSHMDLKPDNIVFDGTRLWLVDWQAAFTNDRYFDLAVAGNFVLRSDADERAYLEAYFGRPATEYEGARFFLMSQFLHLLGAAVFLILGSASRAENESDGRRHWAQLLENVRQCRFDDSLRIVAARAGADRLFPPVLG